MKLNTETLPDNVEELKFILIDLEERYLLRIEFLEERIRFLTKELIGCKSEKRPLESELRQLQLFNEAEVIVAEGKKEEPIEVPAHTRQRPKRKPLPENLPRVDEIHDIPEEQKICGCGAHKSCIGEEVTAPLQRAADVIVRKSTREGFGLTVTEAMWKGRPVIGGAVGGIVLQLRDYHTGFLVSSPEGCAFRIRYLLHRPEMARRMGQTAREFVRTHFLITRHLWDYLTLMILQDNPDSRHIEL